MWSESDAQQFRAQFYCSSWMNVCLMCNSASEFGCSRGWGSRGSRHSYIHKRPLHHSLSRLIYLSLGRCFDEDPGSENLTSYCRFSTHACYRCLSLTSACPASNATALQFCTCIAAGMGHSLKFLVRSVPRLVVHRYWKQMTRNTR